MRERKRDIFIAGGTGYMGRQLIPPLLERGHQVRALVRPGSEGKLPPGCTPVIGNALDKSTYAEKIAPADTLCNWSASRILVQPKRPSFVASISWQAKYQSKQLRMQVFGTLYI